MPRPTVAQFVYGLCTVVLATFAMLLLSQTSSGAGVAVIAVAALAIGLLVAATVPAPRGARQASGSAGSPGSPGSPGPAPFEGQVPGGPRDAKEAGAGSGTAARSGEAAREAEPGAAEVKASPAVRHAQGRRAGARRVRV